MVCCYVADVWAGGGEGYGREHEVLSALDDIVLCVRREEMGNAMLGPEVINVGRAAC